MSRTGHLAGRVSVAVWCFGATAGTADEWPQWRGPLRNGISAESLPLDQRTPQAGPTVAWRAAVGKGHSAVSVVGGRAYTLGWDGRQDTVWCFDAADGKLLIQSYRTGELVVVEATPAGYRELRRGKVFQDDGGRVRLRKATGEEIEVPLSRLSREDRLWVERRASKPTSP